MHRYVEDGQAGGLARSRHGVPTSADQRPRSSVAGGFDPVSVLALQRSVGNRAVAHLLGTRRLSVAVQRCCAACGTNAGHDDDAAHPGQGIEGQEVDEFAGDPGQAVQRYGDPRAVRVVQRDATWGAGPVHQVNNLADCVINNKAVGLTWPSLNGTQFWSNAAVEGALARPTLKTTPGAGGGVDSQVDAVGMNTGSFDETVLSAGPWTLGVPMGTIATMFPTLAQCNASGDTTFRANGNPDDAQMQQANRRHEDHHANDHKDAFNTTIVPWDTKLKVAKNSGSLFHGATEPDATAALWAAVGGTPEQVADSFMAKCQAAVIAFHGSPAGGAVEAPTNPTAGSNCATSSADYHNPS